MGPLLARSDARHTFRRPRPPTRTQLGVVVKTIILCYLGLLGCMITIGAVVVLWRRATHLMQGRKPRAKSVWDRPDCEFD
jgi:hypothetical protein